MMKPNYENRMRWTAKPETYEHLIKPYCVACDTPIRPTNYKGNGNFCEKCCWKATSQARKRLLERIEMEELRVVDNYQQAVRSMVV